MDRLALIEERLNPQTVSAVEVSIAENILPTVPEVDSSAFTEGVEDVGEADEEEEGYELWDLEKMDTGKTEDSRSMV